VVVLVARLIRWARDTAIVLAVSLGLVLALELLLRVFAPQSLTGTSLHGEHFSAEDSILGIRYVPGAVWRFRHPEYRVEYAINAAGFRDARQRPERKPAGVTRVLLLGDSFTFGQGVNYGDAWPVVAERLMDRRYPGKLDLVKAGVQGTDTRSQLILLRRLARRLDVDAVVLGFLINDVYTNVPLQVHDLEGGGDSLTSWDTVRSTVFRRVDETPTFHLLTFARRLITSFDPAYIGLYLSVPARGDFLRTPLPPLPREKLQVTEELLSQMASFCDSLRVPLLVLSIPQQFQLLYLRNPGRDPSVDVHLYDRHLEAFASSRGFDWVATLDDFARADTGGVEPFYRLDGHLTPAGNALLASRFVEQVVPRIIGAPTPHGAEDAWRVQTRVER
jgi:lysophospholipase L1-like esterase